MKNNLQLAGGVILNNKNEVLLLHRNSPNRIQWETPGGKVEKNENPKQCVIREIKEELGIDIEITKELGREDFQEDEYTMSYIWFLVKVLKGKPMPLEEKHDDLKFWSWQELKTKKDISPNTKNLVAAYFKNKLLFKNDQ